MGRARWIIIAVIATLLGVSIGILLFFHYSDSRKLLFPIRKHAVFASGDNHPLPPLHVTGNRIAQDRNRPFQLRGVTIPDPSYLDDRNLFGDTLFRRVRQLGANLVRVPVSPDQWLSIHDYLWRYLDPAARWAAENHLYLVIDWHASGNIDTGFGSHPAYAAIDLKQTTFAFWDEVSSYFRDSPGVLFEVFDEPVGIDAETWTGYADDLAATIRRNAPNQMVIVDGIDYGRDLSPFGRKRVTGGNIAYGVRILPTGAKSNWDHLFGLVSRTIPVVVTEWGYVTNPVRSNQDLKGTAAGFGGPVVSYLGSHGIGWIAAWFDDRWQPAMFDTERKPNAYGSFLFETLRDSRAQPSGR